MFDPRRDNLLNITADDSHFEQSLRQFHPPLEQPEESMQSAKARPGHRVEAGVEHVLSDDSVIRGFLKGELFKSFEKSSYYAESENTENLKQLTGDRPDYLHKKETPNPQSHYPKTDTRRSSQLDSQQLSYDKSIETEGVRKRRKKEKKPKQTTYREIVAATKTLAVPEKTSLDELGSMSLRLKPDSAASIDLDPFLEVDEMKDIQKMKPTPGQPGKEKNVTKGVTRKSTKKSETPS